MRVLSDGRIAYNTSLRRYKDNIQSFENALQIVNNLIPRTFTMKPQDSDGPLEEYERENRVHYGFVVEEVQEAAPMLVDYGWNFDENIPVPQMWKVNDLISILTKAVQELSQQLSDLKQTVDERLQ